MELDELIKNNLSQEMVQYLVPELYADRKLFEQLYGYVQSDDERLAWRSTWVMEKFGVKYPELVEDKLPEIIVLIQKTKFVGVKRSLLVLVKELKYVDFDVAFINYCFETMLSPTEAPAIQVNCMRILYNVCKALPEFSIELKEILMHVEPEMYSVAFAAARRDVLKRLLRN